MTPSRRNRIAALLDRIRSEVFPELRAIDVEETEHWLSVSADNRTPADTDAFDAIGDAAHHLARLVAALTKAKERKADV